MIGEKIVQISGMTCEHCVNRVMRALNKIDGVSANVSLKGKRAVVSYDREIDVNVLKKGSGRCRLYSRVYFISL